MMDLQSINFVKLTFGQMTLVIIISGFLMNICEKNLPHSIRQSFRFGKMSFKGVHNKYVSMLEVPKSYFRHFYIYSSLLFLLLFGYTIAIYNFKVNVSENVILFLDKIGGINRISKVSPVNVLLAEFLLVVQCLKRVYDSNFISVFSKGSKMNLSHYACGYIHYTGCALAILLEAPLFTKHVTGLSNYHGYGEILASLIFLVACFQQLKVAIMLANLRKNKKGKVVSENHHLPEGGLFTYLSSPHMTCEIVMYTCLTFILRGNNTWLYVFAWVLSNQIEVILLNHWWYKTTFTNFPVSRKALIPFIY